MQVISSRIKLCYQILEYLYGNSSPRKGRVCYNFFGCLLGIVPLIKRHHDLHHFLVAHVLPDSVRGYDCKFVVFRPIEFQDFLPTIIFRNSYLGLR